MLFQPGSQSHVHGVWFFSANRLITGQNLEWTSTFFYRRAQREECLGSVEVSQALFLLHTLLISVLVFMKPIDHAFQVIWSLTSVGLTMVIMHIWSNAWWPFHTVDSITTLQLRRGNASLETINAIEAINDGGIKVLSMSTNPTRNIQTPLELGSLDLISNVWYSNVVVGFTMGNVSQGIDGSFIGGTMLGSTPYTETRGKSFFNLLHYMIISM